MAGGVDRRLGESPRGLQGRLSYPTVVFLDEQLNMLSPVPGYQKPEPFLNIARYFGENIYKDTDWNTYSGNGK